MANKIGIVLALDGEKEFSQGLKTAASAAKEAKSKLKELDTQYSGSANSIEALRAKQEALTEAQSKYADKVNAAQSGLDHANTTLEKSKQRYEELKTQVDNAKKALQDMEAAGKSGTSAYSDQATEVQRLEQALADQGNECSKAQQKVSDYGTKLNTAQAELNQMNTAVAQNEQYLSEAEASADGCATSIDQYGNEVQQATTVTTTMGDKLKQAFANAATTAGMRLLRQGVRELVEAFKEMVSVGSEFEASMSNVSALSGATGSELDSLNAKAQELGNSTKFTASEVADAFSYMALAGWDTEQMLDGISGVLYLAAASGMELADASDMVTDYLTAFNMEASEATTVADMLSYAQANSNTTAEQLGEAYKNCAANLNAAGQDIQTVTACLEAMANQGYKGSEAGTALKAVMRDITNNMKDGAIAIGETTVAVQDQNGNYRDLTDILKDVETATDGMGTAEKQAAMSTTFTSRSLSAMNLMLNEGVGSISSYEDALRNCDGAASDMATTMQDNLEGDMTRMNSALQGLEVQIYDYFNGPLRSVVEGVTDILNNVTNAITPQEQAVEDFVNETKNATDGLKEAAENVESITEMGTDEAASIEALGSVILNLNDKEELSALEKERLRDAVDQLSQSIPELGAAFDEETGHIDLTNEAIQQLIESSAALALDQAAEAAHAAEENALAEAELALAKAEIAQEALEQGEQFYGQLGTAVEELYDAVWQYGSSFDGLGDYVQSAMDVLNEGLASGVISMQEYEEWQQKISSATTLTALEGVMGELSDAHRECAFGAQENAESMEELSDTVDECRGEMEDYEEALARAKEEDEEWREAAGETAEAEMRAAEATKDNSAAAQMMRDAAHAAAEAEKEEADALITADDELDEYGDDAEDAAESTDELGESAEKTAEDLQALRASADDVASAMEASYSDAFNSVIDLYNSTKETLAQGLDIDFRTEFNGGADETVESMIATSQENIAALQQYATNLEIVKDHVGQEIAPEFLAYLESLGTDGANTLQHIAITFEQDNGSELISQWSDNYLETLSIEDEIAETLTMDQLMLENGLADLGSTEAEWDGLQSSFESAIDLVEEYGEQVSVGTRSAFEEAAQAAQEAGVSIPDGLASGMESGEYTVEDATNILNDAMKGQFDALAQIAADSGIEVSDNLADGAAQGGQAAADAINSLIDEMTTAVEGGEADISSAADATVSGSFESAGEGAGDDAGQSIDENIAESIESNAEVVTESVKSVMEEAETAVTDSTDQFTEAGKQIGEAIAEGLENSSDAMREAIEGALQEVTDAADDIDVSGFEEVGEKAAEEFGNGMAAGMSGDSGDQLAQAAIDALNARVADFEAPGNEAWNAYLNGLDGGQDGATTSGDALAQAALDAANALDGSFEEPGSTSGENYSSGIASQTSNASSQARAVAQAAVSALEGMEGSFTSPGSISGSNYASGIASQAGSAASAASSCASAALSAVQGYTGSFASVGSSMMAGLASGIASGGSAAISAAASVASQALSAAQAALQIHSPSKAFRDEVGLMADKGLAQGLEAGTGEVRNSATEMAMSALYAAQDALEIESPSKKFKKKVGEMISKGTADGIISKKNLAEDAADSLSTRVYQKATAWLKKYKKSHDTSVADEKYYWKQIAKCCKEGTAAYSAAIANLAKVSTSKFDDNGQKKDVQTYYSDIYSYAEDYLQKRETLNSWSLKEELNYWEQVQKTLKKGTDAWYEAQEQINSIASNMGSIDNDTLSRAETTLDHIKILNDVSTEEEISYWQTLRSSLTKYSDAWYEVTEKINDLKEESYDNIIDAASDYVSKQEALDQMSVSEQLAYWEQIQKEVKKGSDAWYEAQQKINSIKSKIGTVSNMNSLLSAYTTYYDVSAKAEMQYWDAVRQQYQEGTDERLEADQKYFEAKEEYTEKLEDLEDDYLAKVEDVNKQLESDIKSLTDTYNSQLESRISELKNAYGLFDEFTSSSVSGQELLFNIQSQAAGYEAWSDALDTLEERGILSDELLTELTDMGPEEIAAIYALLDLTDEELTAYQDAFDRKMNAVQKQAEEDTADLLAETERQTAELKAQAEKDIAELTAAYDADVASVNQTITSELQLLANNTKNIAEDQTAEIVNAINGGMASLESYFASVNTSKSSATSAASSTASSATSSGSSSSTTSSTPSEISKILEIINSGTYISSLTAKQRANHSELTCYLVDNYQRALTANQGKKLGKALGVDVDTSGWKKRTLNALKKKGFATGGKVEDEYAWMDEELDSIGPEMVVSRADNALLTRLPRGSEIIDANTTDNLLRLAKMDPDNLASVVEKQQSAIMSMASSMSDGSELNKLANMTIGEMGPSFSTATMEDLLYQMEDLLEEYMPMISQPREIGFDKDQMVEQLADGMSNNFAMRSRRMRA